MNQNSLGMTNLQKDGSASSKDAPVIISGWLKKMRRKNTFYKPTWDKRWVSIQNGAISWRHSQESRVSGSIPINQVAEVYKIEAVKRKSSNESGKILVVKSKKRNLCLRANNREECDKWVRIIQLQIDLFSGGTFAGPLNAKNQRKRNGGGDKYDLMMKTLDENMTNLGKLDMTPKHDDKNVNGLNKYRKSQEHRRLFESMRFQSPNSDLSSVDGRNCLNDAEVINQNATKIPAKTMFLV